MNDFREYKNYCDQYLAHHGIKGQHWGVKNGPPYPLDQKVSRAIKAGKNETRSSGKNAGTQHTSAVQGKSFTVTNKILDEVGGWDEFFKKDWDFKKQYSDSDLGLKEVNKFGKWINAAELDEVKKMGETNFDYDKMTNMGHTLISKETKQAVNKYGFDINVLGFDCNNLVKDCNNWQPDNPYVQNNCVKCSTMMELIKRGMDPSMFSAGRSQHGMTDSATSYSWDGAVDYKEKSYENIENRIKKFGNKGSGVIAIRRADGSGHAMHFSTVQDFTTKEYRIEVQDGQVGKVYKNLQEALNAQGHDPSKFCKITRLDNATPNLSHMVEDNMIRMDVRQEMNWQSGVQDLNKTRRGEKGDISINAYNSLNRNSLARSDGSYRDWH